MTNESRHPVSLSSGAIDKANATPSKTTIVGEFHHPDELAPVLPTSSNERQESENHMPHDTVADIPCFKNVGTPGTSGTGQNTPHNDAGLRAVLCSLSPENMPEIPDPDREHIAMPSRSKSRFSVIQGESGNRNGVFWTDSEGCRHRLCSPLRVKAQARDVHQKSWGCLLEWCDNDGITHTWVCPMALLAGKDTSEFFRTLADGGLAISSVQADRSKLIEYVNSAQTENATRLRCVDRPGWLGDNYVLPGTVYGAQETETPYFIGQGADDYAQAGTLEQWQQTVAAMAVGNTRIVFALSVAFAGVLLKLAGESGGGFHFVGPTSIGKTTMLLEPAAGAWGPPERFAKKWRATANGLEGACVARNDNLLILDELAQVSPDEAGNAVYMIANGQAKSRMARDGSPMRTPTWCELFLSAGETDLLGHMADAKRIAKGGQLVRLPSIPADAGAGMGTLENLHGHPDSKGFADTFKRSVHAYYGKAGDAFLKQLTAPGQLEKVRQALKAYMPSSMAQLNVPAKATPEVTRMASRFALVAFAGSLATQYGITGWNEREAENAARSCFAAWLAEHDSSTGSDEQTVLDQVSGLLGSYGPSHFPSTSATPADLSRYPYIMGYLNLDDPENVEFWVLPTVFKDAFCKGYSPTFVKKVLTKRGWLKPGNVEGGGSTQRHTCKKRIAALGKDPVNVYVLTAKARDDDV